MQQRVLDGRPILLCDSATALTRAHRGAVVVCGSHGGVYPGYLCARAGLRAGILVDAGFGLDDAGVAGLAFAEKLGIAMAAVGHDSARIGDAANIMKRGTISRANSHALAIGCVAGMSCREAARALTRASEIVAAVPAYEEARREIPGLRGNPSIVLVDSASLVEPQDAGKIIVTGSHGGLVGGDPEAALGTEALAAFFHDAGIGADEAGVARISALDRRGIIAGTVAADTARIGEAASVLATGRLSRVNDSARRSGLAPGKLLCEAVATIQREAESANGGSTDLPPRTSDQAQA